MITGLLINITFKKLKSTIKMLHNKRIDTNKHFSKKRICLLHALNNIVIFSIEYSLT